MERIINLLKRSGEIIFGYRGRTLVTTVSAVDYENEASKGFTIQCVDAGNLNYVTVYGDNNTETFEAGQMVSHGGIHLACVRIIAANTTVTQVYIGRV